MFTDYLRSCPSLSSLSLHVPPPSPLFSSLSPPAHILPRHARSIGSFAAAIGAVISGIFGMNLKSKFEESIAGFYGVTFGIILGCAVVCYSLWRFAKKRRIL